MNKIDRWLGIQCFKHDGNLYRYWDRGFVLVDDGEVHATAHVWDSDGHHAVYQRVEVQVQWRLAAYVDDAVGVSLESEQGVEQADEQYLQKIPEDVLEIGHVLMLLVHLIEKPLAHDNHEKGQDEEQDSEAERFGSGDIEPCVMGERGAYEQEH